MTALLKTLVRESASAPGTGDVTLGGAAAGRVAFGSVLSDGQTFTYVIEDSSKAEWGIGTYSASGNTVSRTTVKSNTSGATSPLNFAGTVTISIALITDGDGLLIDKVTTTGGGLLIDGVQAVTTTGTQTLTNKTLSGGTLDGVTIESNSPILIDTVSAQTGSSWRNNGVPKGYIGTGNYLSTAGSVDDFGMAATGTLYLGGGGTTNNAVSIDGSGNFIVHGSITSGSDVIYKFNGIAYGVMFAVTDGMHYRAYSGCGHQWDIAGSPVVTIDSSGRFLIGTTSAAEIGAGRLRVATAEPGETNAIADFVDSSGNQVILVATGTDRGWNFLGPCMFLAANSTTGRSINAAGTVNASGADYAEYETKRDDCGVIAKGDLCGFDADGLLTDVFATAVSFGIKSTDPSYVGGDVWGTEDALGLEQPEQPVRKEAVTEQRDTGETDEAGAPILETVVIEPGETDAEWQVRLDAHAADKAAFDAILEAARQRVDRIAYSGKVPLNHGGASFNVGDYVVPVEAAAGGIEPSFVAKADLTLVQHMDSVGYVRRIGADGRPVVAVKVG